MFIRYNLHCKRSVANLINLIHFTQLRLAFGPVLDFSGYYILFHVLREVYNVNSIDATKVTLQVCPAVVHYSWHLGERDKREVLATNVLLRQNHQKQTFGSKLEERCFIYSDMRIYIYT